MAVTARGCSAASKGANHLTCAKAAEEAMHKVELAPRRYNCFFMEDILSYT
jgi:hypothetical protein